MKKCKIKTRPEKPQKPELSNEMKILLKEAYTLFSYNLEGKLSVCTCPVCITEENVERLITVPIREISRELLYEYLEAVNYDEIGYEIKHFLPRILELCANYEYIRLDTSLNLDKCHFERKIWKEEELEFMKKFSIQFVIDVLNTDHEIKIVENISNYILMFDLAGMKTDHLLNMDIWTEKSNRINALKHLEELMYYYTSDYTYFKHSFSENPEFNNQINEWIGSRELSETFLPIIEEYYFNNPNMDYEEQWRMNQLYNVLERNLEDDETSRK